MMLVIGALQGFWSHPLLAALEVLLSIYSSTKITSEWTPFIFGYTSPPKKKLWGKGSNYG